MKLFYTPGACSMFPHMVLREAGFQPTLVRVDLATHKTEGGEDFYAVNPKGYVPALQLDDGQVLTEAAIVSSYIADQKPQSGLLPASGLERYRVLELVHFIATEIHKNYSQLFNPALPEEQRKAVLAKIDSRLALLEKQYGQREFLVGNGFTLADAYLFTMLTWGKKMGPDLSKVPGLVAHHDRIGKRPAVLAMLEAEGLLKK